MSQDTLALIEKRIAVFHYILKAHTDSTSGVSKTDIDSIYQDQSYHPNSVYCNFYLGYSISTIVSRYTSLNGLLKALGGALKDYENLKKKTSDPTAATRVAQVGKRIFRRTSSGLNERAIVDRKTLGGPASMSTEVDLSYMSIWHLPCLPDPFQTFLSLCESFERCYGALKGYFVEEIHANGVIGRNDELYELLQKFDSRVNKSITAPIIKEIDSISRNYASREIQSVS